MASASSDDSFKGGSLLSYASYYLRQTPEEHDARGTRLSEEDEGILRSMVMNARMNGPQDWGGLTWTPEHVYSMLGVPTFPTEDERQELVHHVQVDMPNRIYCPDCREHWKSYAAGVYPYTETGLKFFKWLVDGHNWVNVHKKNIDPISYDEAAQANINLTNITRHMRRATQENRGIEHVDPAVEKMKDEASYNTTAIYMLGFTVAVLSVIVGLYAYSCGLPWPFDGKSGLGASASRSRYKAQLRASGGHIFHNPVDRNA